MDWAKIYHRVQRADWGDIAQAIHDSVTMRDVIQMYTPDRTPRRNRIQCPIHNGHDYNFSFTPQGYKCFVCGASGDMITFVKEVCELSTRADAMKRINQDFNLRLPIDCDISVSESETLKARRKAAKEKEQKHQAWESGLKKLWDEWARLDRQKLFSPPGSDEWASAVKRMDVLSYQIDCYPPEPR